MFNISFTINNMTDHISGFDLGHISISSNDNIISSFNREPDQSNMVFLTIVEMLDGLRKFWQNKKTKEYKLVCVNSSFSILFVRKRSGLVNIEVDESTILDLHEKMLAKQVYDSCYSFYKECKIKMIEDDPIIEDIEESLQQYKKSLLSSEFEEVRSK